MDMVRIDSTLFLRVCVPLRLQCIVYWKWWTRIWYECHFLFAW